MQPVTRLKIILPLLILLASAAVSWAMMAFEPHPAQPAAEPEIPLVQVIEAQAQTLRLNVFSQGVVTAREEIDLVTEISGKIVKLHPALIPGGFFADHDILLSIDPRDYDYAITAAEAGVAEAKRAVVFERAQAEQARSEWQALGEGEASDLVLHKPQLAEAEAKLQAAIAELAKARLNRSRCELHAPFAGRVLAKQVGLGQYVQAGATIARIHASDVAEIRLPIGSEQLAFLNVPLGMAQKAGQWPSVTLRADLAGRQQVWQGRIVRSEAALDPASGQLYLVAQVNQPYKDSPDHAPLLNGLFVRAEIEGVTREGLFKLPRGAVDALHQAKVVNAEQRLEIRPLEVLRAEGDHVIVRSGLQAGDSVIVSELPVPVAGMRVTISPDTPAAPTP